VSRIGRMPITVPAGVQVDIKGYQVKVKGPKGELQREFSRLIDIAINGSEIAVARRSDNPAERALHGTTRAVLHNMIYGVSTGFCHHSRMGWRWLSR
jgi:large subunit ribosomal protein L6